VIDPAALRHQINNPLAAILANLEFALEEALLRPAMSSELVAALTDARDAARRIAASVRELSSSADCGTTGPDSG